MLDLKRRIGDQHQDSDIVKRSLQRRRIIVVGFPNDGPLAALGGKLVRMARDEDELRRGDESFDVLDDAGC